MAETIEEQPQLDPAAEIGALVRDTQLTPFPERVENPRVVARVNTWQSRQRDAMRDQRRESELREWQLRNQATMQEAQFRIQGLNALNSISRQQAEAQQQELLRENNIRAQSEAAEMMKLLPSIDVKDPEYRRKVAEIQARYPYGAATAGMRGIIDSYDADRRAFISADVKARGGEAAVQRNLRRNGATEEEIATLYDPDGAFDIEAADSLLYEVNQRNAIEKRDEGRQYRSQTGVQKAYSTARAKSAEARARVDALQSEISGLRRGDTRLPELQNRLLEARARVSAQDEIVNELLADDPSLATPSPAVSAPGGAQSAQPSPSAAKEVSDRIDNIDSKDLNWADDAAAAAQLPNALRAIANDQSASREARDFATRVLNDVQSDNSGRGAAEVYSESVRRNLAPQAPASASPAPTPAPARSMTLAKYRQLTGDDRDYSPGTRLRDSAGKVIVITGD